MTATVTFAAATPDRWRDLATLFGPRGACGGCWCMAWRLPSRAYQAGKGSKNRRRLRTLVASGAQPGILAYAGAAPVGWCSVAPREQFGFLARSRVLAPVDEAPVWSISCLFLERSHRRQGLSARLLRAAAAHAVRRGAGIVEGYPVEATKGKTPDPFLWTGVASSFRRAGFVEVLRRSPTRPIMRWQAGS